MLIINTIIKKYKHHYAFSALTLLVGSRKGIRPVKNMGDDEGGHWSVRMEWCPAGWSLCLLVLIFPCSIKFRNCLLAPAHLGGPGKRAIKWLYKYDLISGREFNRCNT